mgnify:CR=1 FL=1
MFPEITLVIIKAIIGRTTNVAVCAYVLIQAWPKAERKNLPIKTATQKHVVSCTIHSLNIPKFKKMLNDHMDGNADYKSYIWRVYVLVKWIKNNNLDEKNYQ